MNSYISLIKLDEINNAFSVFSVIAKGAFHYTDILNKANLPTSSALYDVFEYGGLYV